MAIPIERIKQRCCDDSLGDFTIICADDLDRDNPTCDKVIECNDRYVLVEEKSILLGFFHSCCLENNERLEDYKYLNGNDTYLRISDLISKINTMNIDVKKRLLSENITDLLVSSLGKVSHTTHMLATQFNSQKTANMSTYYLYCNSGQAVDRVMSAWLSRYKKEIFIECNKLKEILEEGCA